MARKVTLYLSDDAELDFLAFERIAIESASGFLGRMLKQEVNRLNKVEPDPVSIELRRLADTLDARGI